MRHRLPHSRKDHTLSLEYLSELQLATERLDAIVRAINGKDDTALKRLIYSYAPFHCPECALCYSVGTGNGTASWTISTTSSALTALSQGHFHVFVMGL